MIKFAWNFSLAEKDEIITQHPILNKDFSIHGHDFTELVIIINGEGKHIINGKSYVIQKGDVYVLKEGMQHGFSGTKHLEMVNLLFNSKEVLLEEVKKGIKGYRVLFEIEPLYRIEHGFDAKLTLDPIQYNEVKNLTKEIDLVTRVRSTDNKIMGKILINLLVAKLSLIYDHKDEQIPKRLLLLSSTLDYIETHLEEELDTETLARKSNFSARHFSRLFKGVFGVSPKHYIMNARLSHACSLLTETDMTVSQIASKCGYPDSSYFAKIFLDKYNFSPKDYRKKTKFY